tara:strand:+ start:96 stop:803 length:708 start_codon:yes stop_codon:yes gene_type:complete
MITFRQHIEMANTIKKDESMLGYIETLEASKKIQVTRDIVETYPLKTIQLNNLSLNSNFNYITDVMDMVLGQFIMTEQIITGKTQYNTDADNDLALAQLIFRPRHHTEFDNDNIEDEAENTNKILDSNVTEIYSVLSKYLDNRELVLFKQFAGVFYETPSEDEDVSEEDNGGEQLFQQQWYWYSMVRLLAKEDITKYGKIYMLKMATVMPEMSFIAQRSKIDSARQRQSQALSKL